MGFTGYAFVLFFAAVMAARWLLPARFARTTLLVASLLFYLTWGWKLAVLLVGLTTFTYAVGQALAARPAEKRKGVLAAGVVALLGVLAVFKYAAFFLSFVPGVKLATALPLPLGISFYVFEMVSYLVDVHRGGPTARSLRELVLYVAYFPHLVAGPIVRANELLPQLREDVKFDAERTSHGMFVVLVGLIKKTVIADNLAGFADAVFKSPSSFDAVEVAVGVAAYTGQIFCDFSGYTDIARGSSLMLGYELPENFDYPYLSASITEFWRRWHMTLSRWLRDYLYISLGGNRGGELATYRNLMLTMALGGLWHGARWTFVLWGVYHGALLAAHKLFLGKTRSARWKHARTTTPYRVLSVAGTLVLVMIGWVFFRATSFGDAIEVLRRVLFFVRKPGWLPTKAMDDALVYLGAVVVLHVFGAQRLGERTHRALHPSIRGLAWAGMIAVCYWLATASPTFIYFYF